MPERQKKPPLSAEQLEQKIYTLLGFAQKAGKLVSGDDSVFASLNKKNMFLIFAATDLSDNSRQKFEQKLASAHKNTRNQRSIAVTQVHSFGSKIKLGQAIGKSPRGLIAVLDANFAQTMAGYLQELESHKGVV